MKSVIIEPDYRHFLTPSKRERRRQLDPIVPVIVWPVIGAVCWAVMIWLALGYANDWRKSVDFRVSEQARILGVE